MNKILCFVSLLFYCTNIRAQYPGYVLVNHPEAFKKSFTGATAKTESIRSDFVQEKFLTILTEKIVSKGKFCYRRKDKLRMEYTEPYSYLMILNTGKIFVRDGQKENKFSTSSNKIFQQVSRILIDCVSGTMLDNSDFQSRIFENGSTFLLELKPHAKNLRELYKNINIAVDKKDFSATTIEMYELSGDKTIIRFQNKELNAPIPDSLFNIP
jgi:outer membrane lipoprotein-sorting protein